MWCWEDGGDAKATLVYFDWNTLSWRGRWGVRQQPSPAARGGHADPVGLCCVVKHLNCRNLGGGCKLWHHCVGNGRRPAGYVRPGWQHPRSNLKVRELPRGWLAQRLSAGTEPGKDACRLSVTQPLRRLREITVSRAYRLTLIFLIRDRPPREGQ